MVFYLFAVKGWVKDFQKKTAHLELAGNRRMELSNMNSIMHEKAMPIRSIRFKDAKKTKTNKNTKYPTTTKKTIPNNTKTKKSPTEKYDQDDNDNLDEFPLFGEKETLRETLERIKRGENLAQAIERQRRIDKKKGQEKTKNLKKKRSFQWGKTRKSANEHTTGTGSAVPEPLVKTAEEIAFTASEAPQTDNNDLPTVIQGDPQRGEQNNNLQEDNSADDSSSSSSSSSNLDSSELYETTEHSEDHEEKREDKQNHQVDIHRRQKFKSCMKVKTLAESLKNANSMRWVTSKSFDSIRSSDAAPSAPCRRNSFSATLHDEDDPQSSSSNHSNTMESQQPTPRLKLQWGAVEIRIYSQCLGDNPACSEGPPISLDWDYESLGATDLQLWERLRRKARQWPQQEGPSRLSNAHRKTLLLSLGYTPEQIESSIRHKTKHQNDRIQTVTRLPYMAFDERMEQVSRILPIPKRSLEA